MNLRDAKETARREANSAWLMATAAGIETPGEAAEFVRQCERLTSAAREIEARLCGVPEPQTGT